jgi:hypothetical protein
MRVLGRLRAPDIEHSFQCPFPRGGVIGRLVRYPLLLASIPQPIYYLLSHFPMESTMVNDSTQPTPQPVQQTVVIKEKQGWSLGTRILLWLIAIVVVVSVVAVLTLTVAVIDTPTGSSFPYTTTYRVSLPDSEPISIGSSKILVVTMGNEVDTSVDGVKERLAIGQERTISARYARISALGQPVIDTDFQIVLKYIGSSGNNALFDMRVMTSRQVPEILIRQIIPPRMGAQPI